MMLYIHLATLALPVTDTVEKNTILIHIPGLYTLQTIRG